MADGGSWSYRPHDMDGHPRGLYRGGDGFMGPLPFVHARIIRQNGAGRPTGTDYLMSGTLDGTRVIISDEVLRTGEWAPILDLVLSADDRIQKAAATAIRDMAHRDALRTTPTPKAQPDGMLSVPVPEALPDGYLATAPVPREVANAAWAELVTLAARTAGGKMALVLGAVAFGPFMMSLRIQSHMIDLFGEAGAGKSTTARVAGGVWGNSLTKGAGTLIPWDATGIGIGRHAGQLGCLPVLTDESGMSTMGPIERAQFLFRMAESGGARLSAERLGTGTRRGLPWGGVFVNTGNGAFIDESAVAGRLAGVLRRVIALDTATPFTASREDAERCDALLEKAYGHLGHWVLRRYSIHDAGKLMEWATRQLGGIPAESHAGNITALLASHVAGAAMVDQICGTGTALQNAAITAARDYLTTRARSPQTDASRLLETIREAIGTTPGDWPTKTEYEEWHRPRPEHVPAAGSQRAELPQHGLNRTIAGIRADDDSWIVVSSTAWHRMMGDLGADSSMVLQVLDRAGLIHVAKSLRSRGEWKGFASTAAGRFPGYRISLPPVEDDDQEQTAAAPAGPAPDPVAAYLDQCLTALRQARSLAELELFPWAEMTRAAASGRISTDALNQMRHADAERRRFLTDAAAPAPAPEGPALFAEGSADPSTDARPPAPAPAPAAAVIPPQRSEERARTRKKAEPPRLDISAIEQFRHLAETDLPAAIQKARKSYPTKAAMRLLEESQTNARLARYLNLRRDLKPAELTRPGGPKTRDQIFEAHHGWSNPAVPEGTPVDPLDVNGSYVSAMKCHLPQATVLERVDGAEYVIGRDSGMVRLDLDGWQWPEKDMPSPLGDRQEAGLVWVADPTVRLLWRLHKAGRCEMPRLVEALRCEEASENLLELMRLSFARARMDAITSKDKLAEEFVKATYSQFVSTMGESNANWEIERPDWMHIIRAQASMNLWLRADKLRAAGFVIAKVAGTDEVHIVVEEGKDWREVFPEGRDLSEMKTKGVYEWTAPVAKSKRRGR
jgi:hypothetical protein